MAAVISGMFTVFITNETGETDLGDTVATTGSSTETGKGTDYKLGPGMIVGLAENEKIETANPGRPNTAYDPFVNSIFKQIGVGLGIPYEVLMKSFNSSYSAARASLLAAWRFFKHRRKWLADSFCQVVYEIWMYEAVALGRIQAPGFFTDPLIRKAYLGVEWVGPSQGQIDPVKEVDAADRRVKLGISTVQRETSEYSGEDFDMNKAQIRREREFFKSIGGNNK
jgi:capsid protein